MGTTGLVRPRIQIHLSISPRTRHIRSNARGTSEPNPAVRQVPGHLVQKNGTGKPPHTLDSRRKCPSRTNTHATMAGQPSRPNATIRTQGHPIRPATPSMKAVNSAKNDCEGRTYTDNIIQYRCPWQIWEVNVMMGFFVHFSMLPKTLIFNPANAPCACGKARQNRQQSPRAEQSHPAEPAGKCLQNSIST